MSGGIYGAALAYLLGRDATAASRRRATAPPTDLKPRPPHFPAKAKSVIHLFMNGGPSQMDLFDPKPMLDKHHGKPYFDKIAGEVENIQRRRRHHAQPVQVRATRPVRRVGLRRDAAPRRQVDDIALIRSMYTTNLTHEPAIYLIQSGKMGPGRPASGSWVVYGLGSENQNLPAYVVLDDPLGLPVNGVENWQAGFLPPVFQGTRFRSTGSPVLNLKPDVDAARGVAQAERDLIARARRASTSEQRPGQPDLDARIASYELAARMQLAATDALDLVAGAAGDVQEMYGDRPRADRLLRPALPDRPPAGRARRALRAALHQRPDLGHAHQPRPAS